MPIPKKIFGVALAIIYAIYHDQKRDLRMCIYNLNLCLKSLYISYLHSYLPLMKWSNQLAMMLWGVSTCFFTVLNAKPCFVWNDKWLYPHPELTQAAYIECKLALVNNWKFPVRCWPVCLIIWCNSLVFPKYKGQEFYHNIVYPNVMTSQGCRSHFHLRKDNNK